MKPIRGKPAAEYVWMQDISKVTDPRHIEAIRCVNDDLAESQAIARETELRLESHEKAVRELLDKRAAIIGNRDEAKRRSESCLTTGDTAGLEKWMAETRDHAAAIVAIEQQIDAALVAPIFAECEARARELHDRMVGRVSSSMAVYEVVRGMGGITGSIIGGLMARVKSAARKYHDVFENAKAAHEAASMKKVQIVRIMRSGQVRFTKLVKNASLCPVCGDTKEGRRDSGDGQFKCSKCNSTWRLS